MFEYVKLNLERTTQGLLTNKSEFIYADNESPVPANKTYSAYYLTDKSKVYYTNLLTTKYVRQLIRIKGFDLYEQYISIKLTDRETYPSAIIPEITDKDYTKGSINRYFIQKANDKNSIVFEISDSDFKKKLKLFNKTRITWVISGTKEEATLKNTITLRNTERYYKGISKILFPLQYWRPSKDIPVTLEKKLSLLKTN